MYFCRPSAVTPMVQLLQIQEVHPGPHSNACNFCLFFLPVLSRPSFTSRTPDKDQKIRQLFYFFSFKVHIPETSMKSALNGFVHAISKRSKRCLVYKVVHFGSPGWIPMIQLSFCSSCCSTIIMRLERNFSIERFQSYTLVKSV